MDKIFNSPEEVIEANICGGEKKVCHAIWLTAKRISIIQTK